MNINAKWRGILYNTQVVITAIAAVVLAVLVVAGVIEKEMVLAVVLLAVQLFNMFTGALAKIHLTPDAPVEDAGGE